MKNLFLLIFSLLILVTQYIHYRDGRWGGSRGLVLYWSTDMNPTRLENARRFRAWLSNLGAGDVDLRVDPYNGSLQKIVVQGTTGIGADLIGAYGWDMQYLNQVGLIRPLTGPGMAADPAALDPAISNDVYADGAAIAVPFQAGTSFYFVNETFLNEQGIPPPPVAWTFETFETYGRDYVARVNRGGGARRFLANQVDRETLRRSLGLSMFNETFTACVLDRKDHARLLERIRGWMQVDRLIPTAADLASVAVDATSTGADSTALLRTGFYGLHFGGISFLNFVRMSGKPFALGLTESPHGGFPNAVSRSYAVGLYQGGRHPEQAAAFLRYMVSETHNRHTADCGDQLPPVPAWREVPAFRTPAGHTNEWKARELYLGRYKALALPGEMCPWIPMTAARKLELKIAEGYFSGVYSAEKACRMMEEEIEKLIRRGSVSTPERRERFEKAVARQKIIDGAKARGEAVPLDLVDNPFLRAWWKHEGHGRKTRVAARD